MTGSATSPMCYVGTSGWVYPHWRGILYPWDLPSTAWLEYYAARFNTVEINNTFYRLPSEQTFRRWQGDVPEGFRYAVKASRYVTHMKRFAGAEGALAGFLDRACLLDRKLGPILFQLPPHWPCNVERLGSFLSALPRDLRHIVEFRHASWLTEDVLVLLKRHQVVFCIVSLPGFPCIMRTTAPFAYMRLHGAQARYGSSYSEEELQWWAEQVLGFLEDGMEVYVYFNNDAFGYAVQNALRL